MGPRRAERLRERWILSHIFVISCLLVVGLWGLFGVLPSLGEMVTAHWYRVYWDSDDEETKVRALEHLFEETGIRANRTFSNAERQNSPRLRRLAREWFALRGEESTVEPSW